MIAKNFLMVILLLLFIISGGCGGSSDSQITTSSAVLSVDKTEAIASTQDQVTFVALVTNGNGTPLAGKTVEFTVPAGTYPYIVQGQTDGNGKASLNLKHPPVGPNRTAFVAVTATCEGKTSNAVTVTFSNPQRVPANVTLTTDRLSVAHSPTDTVVLTAIATDANGLPLAGQAFTANITPAITSAINPYTDNDGKASIFIPVSAVGVVPITLAVRAIVNSIASNVVNITVTP
jgi:hypothetical protein